MICLSTMIANLLVSIKARGKNPLNVSSSFPFTANFLFSAVQQS